MERVLTEKQHLCCSGSLYAHSPQPLGLFTCSSLCWGHSYSRFKNELLHPSLQPASFQHYFLRDTAPFELSNTPYKLKTLTLFYFKSLITSTNYMQFNNLHSFFSLASGYFFTLWRFFQLHTLFIFAYSVCMLSINKYNFKDKNSETPSHTRKNGWNINTEYI